MSNKAREAAEATGSTVVEAGAEQYLAAVALMRAAMDLLDSLAPPGPLNDALKANACEMALACLAARGITSLEQGEARLGVSHENMLMFLRLKAWPARMEGMPTAGNA